MNFLNWQKTASLPFFAPLFLAAICLLSTLSTAKAAGGLDAGGGYAIRCDDGKLYSWDYVNAPFGGSRIRESYKKAKSTKAILEQIAARLGNFNVEMADSFRDYLKFNDDPTKPSENRIWERSSNPLLPLEDADRMRLPKSCVAQVKKGFRLEQAVIRLDRDGKIVYAADSRVLKALEKNHPLQLSFLYVHEWLRDFTDDAHTLTMVNQLLHAEKWPESEQAFVKVMQQLGIDGVISDGFYPGRYHLVSDPAHLMVNEYDIARATALPESFEVNVVDGNQLHLEVALKAFDLPIGFVWYNSLYGERRENHGTQRVAGKVISLKVKATDLSGEGPYGTFTTRVTVPEGSFDLATEAKVGFSVRRFRGGAGHIVSREGTTCIGLWLDATFNDASLSSSISQSDKKLQQVFSNGPLAYYCREKPAQN
jgi:hypothetical protein